MTFDILMQTSSLEWRLYMFWVCQRHSCAKSLKTISYVVVILVVKLSTLVPHKRLCYDLPVARVKHSLRRLSDTCRQKSASKCKTFARPMRCMSTREYETEKQDMSSKETFDSILEHIAHIVAWENLSHK